MDRSSGENAAATAATPVERARALKPRLAEYAAQCEREGRIAEPVLAGLKAARLFLMTAAKRGGGEGASMRAYVDTFAEIGRTCPSTAWASGILSSVTSFAASLPSHQTRLLFEKGDELACIASSKTGVARPTDGGFLVTGQWAYGSGCLHADWAYCGVKILGGDGAEVGPGSAFVRLSDRQRVRIQSDWQVCGLSGSGSNSIQADNHFVPLDLVMQDSDRGASLKDTPASELENRDLWPVGPLGPLTVLPGMLGAAEGLLESVTTKMNSRSVVGWRYARQSDSELLLGMLGTAAIQIDSAWMHVGRACDTVDLVAPNRTVSHLELAKVQVDCGYAMRLLREAASTLMDIGGPGAFALSNGMQRYWRDLNIGSRHNALNSALSLELYGRALTGRESNTFLF